MTAGLRADRSRRLADDAGRPFYARALRLRHLNPSGTLCFLFLEGSAGLGVILALAELIPWWGVLLLPVCIAAMVKINDLVAGAAVRAVTRPEGGMPRRPSRPLAPLRMIGRAAVPGQASVPGGAGRVYRSYPAENRATGGPQQPPAATSEAATAGPRDHVPAAGDADARAVVDALNTGPAGVRSTSDPRSSLPGGRRASGPSGVSVSDATHGEALRAFRFGSAGGAEAAPEDALHATGRHHPSSAAEPIGRDAAGEGQDAARGRSIPGARGGPPASLTPMNAPPVDRAARSPLAKDRDGGAVDTPQQRARHAASRRYE